MLHPRNGILHVSIITFRFNQDQVMTRDRAIGHALHIG